MLKIKKNNMHSEAEPIMYKSVCAYRCGGVNYSKTDGTWTHCSCCGKEYFIDYYVIDDDEPDDY